MGLFTKLQTIQPTAQINTVELEDGNNLNSLWLAYGTEGVRELINTYDKKIKDKSNLVIVNEHKIRYTGKAAVYEVTGSLSNDMGNMRVSLNIIELSTERKHRVKIDLYDFTSVHYQCQQLAEKRGLDLNLLEADLTNLADQLELYREKLYEEDNTNIAALYSIRELTPKATEKAIEFLSQPCLIPGVARLLDQTGIIGEESNALSLFVIVSSYKMYNTLHGLVQGTTGAGKSHLIN